MNAKKKSLRWISAVMTTALALSCMPAAAFAAEDADGAAVEVRETEAADMTVSRTAADSEAVTEEAAEAAGGSEGIVLEVGATSAQLLTSSETYKPQNIEPILDFLMNELGLNNAGACGLLANIYYESLYDENSQGDYREASSKYKSSGYTSYGICQWHDTSTGEGRWTNLKNYCNSNGYDWTTLEGQLYYLKYELNSSSYYRSILTYMQSVSNSAQGAYDAAYYWCVNFEIPSDKEAAGAKRGAYAQGTLWPEYCEYAKADNPLSGTVEKINGAWYYCENGKAVASFTGFATNSNGRWYVEKGKVTFTKNGVIKDSSGTIGTAGTWYYVTGSKVQSFYTGVANYKNAYGWWYIKNGKVDFTANTVAKNKYGWWYVTGGKVQFGYTGVANYSNANGWWYIKGGKVDFTANTVAKNKHGWWYVTGGKVQFGYTGVANYKNAYGWWYIKGGKVDFSFNGYAKNKYGTWRVKNGKVVF